MSSLRTPIPTDTTDSGEPAPSTQRARTDALADAAPASDARTPRARQASSGNRVTSSAVRPMAPPQRRGGDTLLSLPAPAPHYELDLAERLDDAERHIEDLQTRIRMLENARDGRQRAGGATSQWLVWVVFMIALALAWQIIRTRG